MKERKNEIEDQNNLSDIIFIVKLTYACYT